MNPLLYKAHPLLYLTVDLLANPSAHSIDEALGIILMYLAANLASAFSLGWMLKKLAGFAPSFPIGYLFSLIALVCYLGPTVTILSDVLAHEFKLADRFILVFCLFVAVQTLGGFYAFAIRRPRDGSPIGLRDGLTVSIFLWLISLPIGLAVLGSNALFKMF